LFITLATMDVPCGLTVTTMHRVQWCHSNLWLW